MEGLIAPIVPEVAVTTLLYVPQLASGVSIAKVVRTDEKPVDFHEAVCFVVRDGPRQPPYHEVAVVCFTAPPEGIGPVFQRRHIAGAYEFGLHSVQGPLQSWLRPSWYRALVDALSPDS